MQNMTENEPSAANAFLSSENSYFLRQFIQRESGIVLGDDKEYLLKSRLLPILAQERFSTLNQLCDRMRDCTSEFLRRQIVEALTTHETLFFRDPAVFEALRNAIFPEIIRRKASTRTLRIWSAACSSGQEAYSIAMLLHDLGYGDWNVEIVGTDLSSRILERAISGRFQQIEVSRGLPAKLLLKYFQKEGRDWQLIEPIRRMVKFSLFDLRQNMRMLGIFDLILCRNVLIYFDLEIRKSILAGIRGNLFPGGYMLLGSSETTYNLDDTYLRKEVGGRVVFYQVPE
jgi:chemotaxis protein methyltransferase CheR